jgi:acyl-CoA-binding protein
MSSTTAELTIKARQKLAERKKLNAKKESSDTIERNGLVCPMEFPELFFAACSFAMAPPETAHGVSDDTRLLLYALYQQAVEGDCNTTKPWGWNRFEALKWNAWSELHGLASMDAMMMYVHTLEEDNQGWWYLLTSGGDKKMVKDVCLQVTPDSSVTLT